MSVSRSFSLLSPLLLTACGAAYVSPTIGPEAAGAQVSVVPLTVATLPQANATPYTPQKLPAAFSGGLRVSEPGDPVNLPANPIAAPMPPDLVNRPPPIVKAEPYRLGIGDVVQIITTNDDTLAVGLASLLVLQNQQPQFSIRDDGSITLPDVGTISLAGLTLKEAEAALFDRLLDEQIDPGFRLEVSEFHAQKIAIGGAVNQAKLLPIGLTAPTLAEALSAAGGVSAPNHAHASLRIYRNGTLYQIPLKDYLSKPDLQTRLLLAGDAVFVDTSYDLDRAEKFYEQQLDAIALQSGLRKDAQLILESEMQIQQMALRNARDAFVARLTVDPDQRDYVFLTGEVDNRGRQALPFGKHANLVDILYGSGGFSPESGDPSQIYVLRKGKGGVIAWHLDARNAAALVVAQEMLMRPGDIIFVEEQKITKFGRALDQALPSLIAAAGRVATQ